MMDAIAEKGDVDSPTKKCDVEYKVHSTRWLALFIFVLNSASSSVHWTQYTIIQDAIVKYYGVTSSTVYWTSMIFMLGYAPLVFLGCYFLDKAVSLTFDMMEEKGPNSPLENSRERAAVRLARLY